VLPACLLSACCIRSDLAAIDPLNPTVTVNLVPFYVIGNEGGWFPELQPAVTTLQIGPAERYDVIVDFSGELAITVVCC
jgi:FtsP/CotA-like multicopper oxidase with cupredoxin domain